MTADDLAPWVARSSATMVLTLPDKQILVFHEEGFNTLTGLILGLHLANKRRRYFVTTSLIGWAQT